MAIVAIAAHLILRYVLKLDQRVMGSSIHLHELPLIVALVLGGVPLVWDLLGKMWRMEFGSDLLAGLSIITAVILGQYLAGTLVVLMLSGGEALEAYAVRSASSVLSALARRMPSVAHRKQDADGDGRADGPADQAIDVPLADVRIGDTLLILPHEICPVDGTVLDGYGVMDESFLTGEPYQMKKTPGSDVISGAINGETALIIRADKLAVDSRYAKIMQVMRASEQRRPHMRRLADQLGAYYTPLAVLIALSAWIISGESVRFLAVLVVATPCPLLIAIPVAIIGSISLAARRGIIIKDPAIMERISSCRIAIFDKTGTLTYGKPKLTHIVPAAPFQEKEVLMLVANLERYSKHPLAGAIVEAGEASHVPAAIVEQISEKPGEGLTARVNGRRIHVTSRKKLLATNPGLINTLPPAASGLECVVLIDDAYAATFQFHDEPRSDGRSFIGHLKPKHHFQKLMLVSGDRESEVRHLADRVGIKEVYFSQSPEQKLELVRRQTAIAPTVFMGDGINDAPALTAATVGLAFGQNSDITAEAAGAVIMDSSLEKVDEFMHISQRMHRIALQSAVGGMTLSLVGMFIAAAGYLPPVGGAIAQEAIDVIAVVNALRVAIVPKKLTDY